MTTKDTARTTAQRILDLNDKTYSLQAHHFGGVAKADVSLTDVQTICRAFLEGQEWVAVDERPPEHSDDVLVSTIEINGNKRVRLGWYGNGEWFLSAGLIGESVTAWRERPKPYRLEPEDEKQDSEDSGECGCVYDEHGNLLESCSQFHLEQ